MHSCGCCMTHPAACLVSRHACEENAHNPAVYRGTLLRMATFGGRHAVDFPYAPPAHPRSAGRRWGTSSARPSRTAGYCYGGCWELLLIYADHVQGRTIVLWRRGGV